MPARIQGLKFGLGSAKQVNISTASSTFNTFRKLNMDVPFLLAGTENDKDEIGKGNEFITQVFKTGKSFTGRVEKYGSAEFTAWAWAYALGNTALATGLYTITPLDPGTTVEMPYFSIVSQLAEGGGFAVDEAALGVCVESVETVFHYGPTRSSLRTTCDYVGSGRSTLPSGVVLPAVLAEDYMLNSSASITINGEDYVSAKTILHGSIGWKNNIILPLQYYPGSGLDSDGFAVGGRLFYGNRVPTLTFTAFLQHDSTEYAKLVAQTTGSATIKFQVDATHYVQWAFTQVAFEMVERTQEEGFVAVTVTVAPQFNVSLLTVTSKNAITDICQ
jgi:hypothetical protein